MSLLWGIQIVFAVALLILICVYLLVVRDGIERTSLFRNVRIGAAVGFVVILVGGYLGRWKWTGLPGRTFWDWLDLLIVPLVLAIGGYLFTRSENKATQATAELRAQDEALQAYLDQMGQLLLDKELRKSEEYSEVRTLARARTLTVLPRLNGQRKGSVVQFLFESDLISQGRSVVSLRGADLNRADLRRTNLSMVNLSEAALYKAILFESDLSGADLRGANLGGASLSGANLSGAKLIGANLSEANLRKADLRKAELHGADLRGADLYEADATKDQMTWTLHVGTIMPNGQRAEVWLKD